MKPFVPTVIALTLSVASLAAGAVQPPRPDFVVQGREFAWAFDGMPSGSFDLNQIAPAGTLTRTVRVYIAPTDGELNDG